MAAYLRDIFVIEFQNEKGYIVGTRTIDGINQSPSDERQIEMEEIVVGTFQVMDEGRQGNMCRFIFFSADKIGYSQKSRTIYIRVATDFLYRFFPKA